MTAFAKITVEDSQNYDKKFLRNLVEETLGVLAVHNLSEEDVLWVGNVSGTICMSFQDFKSQVNDILYLPRGRCSYLSDDKGKPSFYYEGDTLFNRVSPDLVVVGDGWFLKRFIHIRLSAQDEPRKRGSIYNESPEFWEMVRVPTKNSMFLVSGKNDVRLIASDNVAMARNLSTLNASKADGDPEFVRHEDMTRNAPLTQRKNGPRRVISSLG